MAESKAVRFELLLEVWPEDAALNQRSARTTVDLQHTIKVVQIDADRTRVAVADVRLNPAHHRRSTAERDCGEMPFGTPGEDTLHIRLIGGVGNQVRRMTIITADPAHEVVIRFAQRMHRALARVLGTERLQRRGRTWI